MNKGTGYEYVDPHTTEEITRMRKGERRSAITAYRVAARLLKNRNQFLQEEKERLEKARQESRSNHSEAMRAYELKIEGLELMVEKLAESKGTLRIEVLHRASRVEDI